MTTWMIEEQGRRQASGRSRPFVSRQQMADSSQRTRDDE